MDFPEALSFVEWTPNFVACENLHFQREDEATGVFKHRLAHPFAVMLRIKKQPSDLIAHHGNEADRGSVTFHDPGTGIG